MKMEFLKKLKNFVDNINTLPYGEVTNFATTIDNDVNNVVEELENMIQEIKLNYRKFGELFTIPKTIKYSNIISKNQTLNINVNGVFVECFIISDYKDTLEHPHKLCIFRNVPNWFFIAFPELGQILPVHEVNGILEYRTDLKNTKIHYGLFKEVPLDSMCNSDYAVFPYNKDTWRQFQQQNKNNWSKYLRQLNICQLSVSNKYAQKIPIYSTNCISEIAKKTVPEDMATEWSLFVQLYFMLYLFRQKADSKHFSI